ncbi:MAG: UDP-N-acetylmuramoyl-tripeptide--D-alanyl-D-alanine ligase [candidate division WOR-3 bacterium]
MSATGGNLVRGSETLVPGISIDTRTLKPNELYIAIRGKRFDGHSFIPDALRAGAVGVVLQNETAIPVEGIVIKVPDTREALQQIATAYRRRLNLKVVAVTGSNGKSTTKEMLATILECRFKVVRAEGSYNNDIGVPLTVLKLNLDTEAAVFEIEMNELGGTYKLARVCQPQVGVITNIGDTHLEFMKDRQGVACEKQELLSALPQDGVAVLNADDEAVMAIGRRCGPKERLTFALDKPADVFAHDVRELGLDGVQFLLQGEYEIRLKVPGRHNVANCLAACAAARALGIGFEEMPESLARFTGLPMRLQRIQLKGVTLIDDCYNANPQSMAEALELLFRNAERRHRLAILGDMLELGESSHKLHEEIGRKAGAGVDRLVLIGPESEAAAEAALQAGLNPQNLFRFNSSSEVGDVLFDIIRPGDTILVKGSRAMGLELIVQKIVSHYG